MHEGENEQGHVEFLLSSQSLRSSDVVQIKEIW